MNNPIANKFEKILVFEGEYSNGKAINGISYDYIKNKEYKLIQGKWTILKYGENGRIKSQIKYVNENGEGKGSEFDGNGNLIFEGNYLDDYRNGFGKKYKVNYIY